MVFVWEFEFYESEGCVVAAPCGNLGYGATFGDDLEGAVESAADFLSCVVDDHLVNGVELPPMEFGHEPENGGRVIALAVSRSLSDVPAMTAADAARELGVSSARVSQLIRAGLLESWREGTRRMVSRASVKARKEESPRAGRPREHVTA